MNSKKLVVLAALLGLASSGFADLKSATQNQFNLYCAAVKRKDAKGIEKVLRRNFSPDFRFVQKTGPSMNLNKWIADEKMEITMTEYVKSVTLHIDSVKSSKGAATMRVSLHYLGMVKMDPKGKAGLLDYVATSDQKLVQKHGRWWITQMKATSSKTTFNGKPMEG